MKWNLLVETVSIIVLVFISVIYESDNIKLYQDLYQYRRAS